MTMSRDSKPLTTDTLCIHGGNPEDDPFGSVAPPIYQTSTFAFDSCDQGAARFAGKEKGYIYTRLGNPTIAFLEEAVAGLEGGAHALATASGMAAVSTLYFALLSAGDHVVCSAAVYGPSRAVLERDFSRFGVKASFVDTSDVKAMESAMTPSTRLLYVETPANPTLALTDLDEASRIAKSRGAVLAVDNTFLSPVLQRPLSFGADVVLHSATKFLNGHADVVGGVLVFKDEALYKRVRSVLHYLGGTMDPHQAWLIQRGLKTMALRVRAAQDNAGAVASLLAAHPAVESVRYPGLPSHPQAGLAARQMDGPGALIAFELKGGLAAGKRLLEGVKVARLAVSLGGVETLIQHPASMTHAGVSLAERHAAGITDGLVRLSVGCEGREDLLDDFRRALDALA